MPENFVLNPLVPVGPVSPERRFFTDARDAFLLETFVGQASEKARILGYDHGGFQDDPEFDPLSRRDDINARPNAIEDLMSARSNEEFDFLLRMHDENTDRRKRLDGAGLWPSLVAGALDPVNFIPVPLLKGVGLVRGAARGGASVGALSVATESLRVGLDPTVGNEDLVFPVLAGTLFGGAIGGAAGAMGRGGFKVPDIVEKAKSRFQRGKDQEERFRGGGARAGEEGQEVPSTRPDTPTAPLEAQPRRIQGSDAAVARQLDEVVPEDLKSVWPRTATGRLKVDAATLRSMAGRDPRIIVSGRGDVTFDPNPGLDVRGTASTAPEMRPTRFAGRSELRGSDLEGRFERGEEGWQATDVYRAEVADLTDDELMAEVDAMKRWLDDQGDFDQRVEELGEETGPNGIRLSDQMLDEAEQNIAIYSALQDELRLRESGGLRPTFRGDAGAESPSLGKYEPIDEDSALDDLVETGTGIEKGLGSRMLAGQLPYFVLKNNKLPGNLHRVFARMADEIAGDPGMTLKGNFIDHANSKSVWTFSMQWRGSYKKADTAMREAWLKYLGKQEISRRAAVKEEVKEVVGGGVRSLGRRIASVGSGDLGGALAGSPRTRPDGKMTFAQFSEETVAAWVRSRGKHDIPEVTEAAEAMGEFFETIGKEAEKFGVFGEMGARKAIERKMNILEFKTKKRGEFQGYYDEAMAEGSIPRADRVSQILDELDDEILELELEIEDLTEAVGEFDRFRGIIPANEVAYYTRNWRLDKIDANPEGLKGKLREHYRKTGGGTADEIELRVNETFAVIRGEAQLMDSEGHVIGRITRDEVRRRQSDDLMERLRSRREEMERKGLKTDSIDRAMEKIAAGEYSYRPKMAIGRKLDIPNEMVLEFIETNPLLTMQHYLSRMAPAIEMARKYGDVNMDMRLAELDVAAKQARLFTRGDEARAELAAEFARQRKALEDLRDQTLGIHGIPVDPSALHNRAFAAAKAHQVVTKMGRAWQAALADVGRAMIAVGTRRLMERAYADILGDSVGSLHAAAKGSGWEAQMIRKELDAAGEIGETVQGMRWLDIMGFGGPISHGTAIERWVRGSAGQMMMLNLLAPWTDMMKRFTGPLIAHNILDWSRMLRDGEIAVGSEQAVRLARAGIDSDMAKRIADQWEAAGAMRGDTVLLANSTEWTDELATRTFRAAMMDDLNVAVITAGPADKPLFMSDQLASVVFQFKQFPMSATARYTISALQQGQYARAFVYQGITASIMLGYVVGLMRDTDFNKESLLDLSRFVRAVDLAGVSGIFMDINNMIEAASGDEIGIRPALGIDPFIKDPNWVQRTGAVLGPSFSSYAGLLWAFTSPDADAHDQARALRYTIPFNNLWFWSDTVGKATRDAADLFED